jgi:hypothetical protein
MMRPGFGQVPPVQHQDLYKIESSVILQPRPSCPDRSPRGAPDGHRALSKTRPRSPARNVHGRPTRKRLVDLYAR